MTFEAVLFSLRLRHFLQLIPHGLMARILGFHPRGPGSIPGVGEHFLYFLVIILQTFGILYFVEFSYWFYCTYCKEGIYHFKSLKMICFLVFSQKFVSHCNSITWIFILSFDQEFNHCTKCKPHKKYSNKTKSVLPHRELNPGLLGESQVS